MLLLPENMCCIFTTAGNAVQVAGTHHSVSQGSHALACLPMSKVGWVFNDSAEAGGLRCTSSSR